MTSEQNGKLAIATQEELDFIADNMPKGMVAMVMKRTGKSRSRVLYHLKHRGVAAQDKEIIEAAREILYAVTRKRYSGQEKKQAQQT